MKNSKKKLVSRAGFTLVELVVTIAVLAILAGVGGAAYGGYIKSANEAVDKANLGSFLTAVQGAQAYVGGEPITEIVITGTEVNADYGATIEIKPSFNDNAKAQLKILFTDTVSLKTSGASGAKWTKDGGWEITKTN